MIRHYWGSLLITGACMVAAFYYGGFPAAFLVFILGVMEVSVSFDNAVVNAKVLKNMSRFWQLMFLTVGIFIAVFAMRLILPIGIVSLAADIGFMDTANMVFKDPETYSAHLHDAHLSISAFGGMFLLMVFLDFFLDAEKEHHWLGSFEERISQLGSHDAISVVVALAGLMGVSSFVEGEQVGQVAYAGGLGLFLYFLMSMLKNAFEDEETGEAVANTAKKAGFFSFLYLEVLDASFSLDGVVGAFAISKDPMIIMMGLGIGAIFVRSITVHLVRTGKLDELVYLEHGAMYAIGALATIMLGSAFVHVPELLTGFVGAILIGLAIISSIRYRKLHGDDEGDSDTAETQSAAAS